MVVLLSEGNVRRVLRIAHNLNGYTLSLAVVESQRRAIGALRHNPHTNTYLNIFSALAGFDVFVLFDEIDKLGVHLELVGVRGYLSVVS